jgi:hypothetical protein
MLAVDGFSLRVVNARDAFAPLRGAAFTAPRRRLLLK